MIRRRWTLSRTAILTGSLLGAAAGCGETRLQVNPQEAGKDAGVGAHAEDAAADAGPVESFPNDLKLPIDVAGLDIKTLSVTPAGGYPQSMVTRDFNNDGKLDIAVIICKSNYDAWEDCTVSLLSGNDDGTFQAQVQVAVNPELTYRDLLAGDFNGDGIDDLVAATGPTSSKVAFWQGYGDGTFAPMSLTLIPYLEYGLYGQKSPFYAGRTMFPGNFGGTNGLEVFIPMTPISVGGAILRQAENGFQQEMVTQKIIELPTNSSVIVADFNHDGSDDAVLPRKWPPYSLFRGAGYYAFSEGETILLEGQSSSAGAMDLDDDGHVDLVQSRCTSESFVGMAVLIGNGDGSFQSPVPSAYTNDQSTRCPTEVVRGEFNDDGKKDLLAIIDTIDWRGLAVFLGDGHGALAGQRLIETGSPVAVAGDFDKSTPGMEIVFAHQWELYCASGANFLTLPPIEPAK